MKRSVLNELAPEARKKLAPAEGRGFRFVLSQPRRGVRLWESIFRPSGPRRSCRVPPASRPGLRSYGPPGLLEVSHFKSRNAETSNLQFTITILLQYSAYASSGK